VADWAEALCCAQRWQDARDKAERAAHLASSLPNNGLEGQALYALGRALGGLGQEQPAEVALLKAHGLYMNVRNKYYRGKIERELSAIHRVRGEYQEALRFLDMALATEASMQREAAMHLGAQQRAKERIDSLKREKSATERVLFNVLPDSIARRMLSGAPRIADERSDVSVVFADVVGFTELVSRTKATDLLEMLDRIFSHLDALTHRHGLAKIKTIGDAYMAAGGVPDSQPDHLERCASLALAMRDTLGELNRAQNTTLALRIGLHVGPVVAGVIGSSRLSYDLWGETVNIASRLESSGVPGRIHVSAQVRDRLRPAFAFQSRGAVALKGLGEMETYFLDAALQ
jgi:class 3 adenylate cyclase